MENKELLARIWNLEHVDRPGLFLDELHRMDKTPGTSSDSIEDHYRAAKADCDRHVRGRDDSHPILSAALGTYVVPMAFGGQERIFDDGHKYLAGPVIFNAKEVDRLKVPNVMTSLLGKQIELIKYAAEKSEGEYEVRIGDVQNPLGIAEMMWETEDFYASLAEEPEQVHKLLGILTEVVIEYISKVKEVCKNLVPIAWPGIWAPNDRGVYIADDTMSMVSPTMYEEYGVYYNNIISREFGGLLLHSCTMKEPYFKSIIKNEGLRSINFAAQYSSNMTDIYRFFGGKAVILPHYCHTDNPQIGTVAEFIHKVADCWTPETPTILYISRSNEGGMQQEALDAFKSRWRMDS